MPRSEISQALRSKLPVYMVPAFLEQVDAIPMTLSNKADYKRLPKPQQLQRFSAAQGYVPPKTDRERMLHAALAEVLHAEHISTEHHFFNDLGANSLLMARVCAAIRRNPGMSNVSMRDIYMHPTIAKLAHHLDSSIDGDLSQRSRNPSMFRRTCRTSRAAPCRLGSTRPICCPYSGSSRPAIPGRPPPTA